MSAENLMMTATPLTAAILLGLVVIAWSIWVKRREGRIAPGDVIWPSVYIAYLLVIFHWSGIGRLDESIDLVAMITWSVVQAGCGVATLFRGALFAHIQSLPKRDAELVRAMRDGLILTIVSVVSAVMVDVAWHEASNELPVGWVGLGAALLMATGVVLYALGQRTGLLVCAVPLSAAGFGIAQHFLIQFKGAAVLPSDLLCLGTAAEVADSYDFILTIPMFQVLCVVGVLMCLLSFVWPGRQATLNDRIGNIAGNAIAGLIALAVLGVWFDNVSIDRDLGMDYNRWQPVETYRACGFVSTFAALLQDMDISEPEGYEETSAESLQQKLASQFDEGIGAMEGRRAAVAQFNEISPTVITVMNETFADLSRYEGLRKAGYEGPVTFNNLEDAMQRGSLDVSVIGGGTANSEFEFLTGNSMAFLGPGKLAYQLYEFTDVDSLPRQFASFGYDTVAVHPQNPYNYNRKNVYQQMGFKTFISSEGFKGAEIYHAGARDRETYDKVLELLRNEQSPQFIFDLTMQNHGGYEWGTVPEEDVVRYAPQGVDDENLLCQLGTYIACIQKSDEDLAYFIEQLRQIGRPVVLVFFGDHQPNFSPTLNDALYPGEASLVHGARAFETSYMVWANYSVEGSPLGVTAEVGAAQLAAQVLYRIGAPLTDYQKAQLLLSQEVPAVSLAGYRGADGMIYDLDTDGPYRQSVDRMRMIQYLHFASKVQ